MTFLEGQQALARKLDIDLADIANNDQFSLADIKEWIQAASIEAWDYKPWPFTETTLIIPTSALTWADGYVDHPDDIVHGSIYALLVSGEEYGQLTFADYKREQFLDPGTTRKMWAYHDAFIFVNSNAYSAGADIDVIGKEIAPALSADADLLPFSPSTDNREYSGNKAIVDLAYANALSSEKLKRVADGDTVRKQSYRTLDLLWRPFANFRSFQRPTRPLLNLPDTFGPNASPPGNFNL